MGAARVAPPSEATVGDRGLVAHAADVRQPYVARPWTEDPVGDGAGGRGEPEHATHHQGILDRPLDGAHGAPDRGGVVSNFHPPLVLAGKGAVRVYQTHGDLRYIHVSNSHDHGFKCYKFTYIHNPKALLTVIWDRFREKETDAILLLLFIFIILYSFFYTLLLTHLRIGVSVFEL